MTMCRFQKNIIPVGELQQNCTVLFDSETFEGVIIDPGDEVVRILDFIRSSHIKVSEIWLTHGHLDHAGAAMEMKKALGGIVILGPHKADAFLLTSLEEQAKRFKIPGKFQNCHVDRYLEEGEIVSFSHYRFKVLHCPGHTPGHVAYYNQAENFLHAGDILFRGSVGRTDLPGGNPDLLMRSIHEKLLTLDDKVAFICGHGPGSTLGEEKRSNPFLLRNQEPAY